MGVEKVKEMRIIIGMMILIIMMWRLRWGREVGWMLMVMMMGVMLVERSGWR